MEILFGSRASDKIPLLPAHQSSFEAGRFLSMLKEKSATNGGCGSADLNLSCFFKSHRDVVPMFLKLLRLHHELQNGLQHFPLNYYLTFLLEVFMKKRRFIMV
jgi:hypothetical protein